MLGRRKRKLWVPEESAGRSFSRVRACQELSCNLFPPATSAQKRDPPVPRGRGWLGWHAGGPSSLQDGVKSPGCSTPGGGFPSHQELPLALLYHEGSGQRGQEGTVQAEHSLGCATLSSNHTLGRLTY